MRLTTMIVAALLSIALAACQQSDAPASTPSADIAPPLQTAAQSAPRKRTACELISLQEITGMLRQEVTATPDEGVGRTGCVWQATSGGMPYLELKVNFGDADAAMMAAGMLRSHEPGINDPYEGLGDQAVITGPAVMIKHGEDLFTITPMGIDDAVAVTRRVFKLATERL